MQIWPAPAKLNLFLHVTGRRPDGYHSLQTVFPFLDYSDELDFRVTSDGKIVRVASVAGVPEDSDLTLRAAQLLQRVSATTLGAEIKLRKRIPMGGGLGGGSSDAATTLLALNRLWGLNLTRAELLRLALQLGADVPVFIGGQAAWGEGVGERLTPIEPEEAWYVVLAPPVHVSTAEVFAELGLTAFSGPITIRDFHAGRAGNDLERVVRRRYPEVDQALTWLARFGQARMTGSGGCVYLKVAAESAGRRILAQRLPGFDGFVARGLNRHPLFEM
jgi:4-diphosphocytidyl-2-C-methyl-D-erythritol kinase